MLQSPTQCIAFTENAESFLTAFVKSYCDQKSMDWTISDVAYCTKNCKVQVPFQSTEWVLKSVAYLAFVAEATNVTTKISQEIGALYLSSRILNFEDRKTELIKFFVRALSRFAELILIECRLTNDGYDKLILWQMYFSTNLDTSHKY